MGFLAALPEILGALGEAGAAEGAGAAAAGGGEAAGGGMMSNLGEQFGKMALQKAGGGGGSPGSGGPGGGFKQAENIAEGVMQAHVPGFPSPQQYTANQYHAGRGFRGD